MNDWINIELLSHPMNWVIVTLVLIFIAYGAFAIWQNAGGFLPSIKLVKKED